MGTLAQKASRDPEAALNIRSDLSEVTKPPTWTCCMCQHVNRRPSRICLMCNFVTRFHLRGHHNTTKSSILALKWWGMRTNKKSWNRRPSSPAGSVAPTPDGTPKDIHRMFHRTQSPLTKVWGALNKEGLVTTQHLLWWFLPFKSC